MLLTLYPFTRCHRQCLLSDSAGYWHLPPHPLATDTYWAENLGDKSCFHQRHSLGTGDFTPYSLHSTQHTPISESTLILPLPDNVLHNLFSVSGSTQFSCSRGRIMWKRGKCSQSWDITAFGIHPRSNLNVLQLNNNTLDCVLTLLHSSYILVPRQMMVDRNLSVMNIQKQLPTPRNSQDPGIVLRKSPSAV